MTLIVSYTSRRYVLQVTDRLLTGRGSTFDPLANKNIVCAARNAVVTMGYTGQAFINKEVPTDQWIVEKLTGITFDRSQKPWAIGPGSENLMHDMGHLLWSLKNSFDHASVEMEDSWRQDWTANNFDLLITGWQWKNKNKRRFRPLLALLSKPRGSNTFDLEYTPRHYFTPGRFRIDAAPSGNIAKSQLQLLVNKITSKPDVTEALMVDVIRQVSKQNQVVGPDCMSIFLLPPSCSWGRVSYIPVMPGRAVLSNPSSTREILAAFSPWLIGPNITVAPSIMSGSGWNFPLGSYTISMDAPDNPKIVAVFSSQERRKP